MKTLDKIPIGKLKRSGKLLKTGMKVGGNYIKYYGDKLVSDDPEAKEKLDQKNANDIYDRLKELKGPVLKVAQMLSMEKAIMPKAFVEKFSLSQFSVPPLSYALVRKTFRKSLGKNPEDIFDKFSMNAINAASIGQVHKAQIKNKVFAVKIQYPGVKDSISNDLRMVKPLAHRMFNIQKEGSKQYFAEVEKKLLEETDYVLELKQSQEFSQDCKPLSFIRFPNYYPEFSCDKIITMDWLEGVHLSEFIRSNPTQEVRNILAQNLWDFYMYQLHVLHKLHADPHPGNFLISKDNQLMVIDFGCVKTIPDSFYQPYMEITHQDTLNNPKKLEEKLEELEFLSLDDSREEKQFFVELLAEILALLTRPIRSTTFDFSDERYFQEIADLGQRYSQLSKLKSMKINRGSKHFIYVNRSLFGLYNMMNALKAKGISIHRYTEIGAREEKH